MKTLLSIALLFSLNTFANEPGATAATPEAKKMTRREAKAKCREANPGLKGKALRECVKKELHK